MNDSNHIEIYRQEAEELLAEIEETILEIEDDPDNQEAVNRLFRAMHTIKGSGSMFGFDDIADFTHHVETALDKVREGVVPVTKQLIDLVLASRDQISAMLDAADSGIELSKEAGNEIIAGLNALLPESENVSPVMEINDIGKPSIEKEENESTYRIRFRPDRDIFSSGMDPALLLEELRELGECIITAQVSEVPSLEDMNPEQCYLFWDIVLTTGKDENAVKDVFIFIEDSSEISIETIDHVDLQANVQPDIQDNGPDYKKLGEIMVERKDVTDEDLKGVLKSQKKIGEMLIEAEISDPGVVKSALAEQEHLKQLKEKRNKTISTSSVRVPADKLDALVDLVGEMVTAQARLSQKASVNNDPDLVLIAEEVERLVNGLRDNTMSIRMLQIGTTFSNFKRLVRDLSQDLGKDISLITEGGETELDKTVIERLNDPLVHIIRNSVDHGIEMPEEREASGKPAHGTIMLSAEHSGAHVLIRISDDGAGIAPETIRKKAVEKGVITPDAVLTDKELLQLVFVPGFSTAKEVTDVSGRGVGMDVVKRNIESLRGSIEIDSNINKGTTITLKLPLTLAIIDGLMVMLGGDRFILPLSSVEECVELSRKEADQVKGRNILNVRGEAVPYIRLREQFEIESEPPPLEQIVITEVNGNRTGFVVDSVIGGHQTVIKSLGPAFKQSQDVSGATILGDGTVALILDVNRLV